jgi:dephospho-CoA kinase
LLFVGLTGGIGSGKSEALAAFERLGAAVLSSDAVVHDLLGSAEVRDLVADRWGERVIVDGRIDRRALAEIVFGQPDELSWLEGVLFPRVGERIAAWRADLERSADAPDLAVVEVPLLFEAGIEEAFDATVAVVAGEAEHRRRAGERDHRGIEGRLARQFSEEEKASRADYVVRNDRTLSDLEREIGELLQKLRAGARR